MNECGKWCAYLPVPLVRDPGDLNLFPAHDDAVDRSSNAADSAAASASAPTSSSPSLGHFRKCGSPTRWMMKKLSGRAREVGAAIRWTGSTRAHNWDERVGNLPEPFFFRTI